MKDLKINAGTVSSVPKLTLKNSAECVIRNALFWIYNGVTHASWLLCGDGVTAAQRTAYIQWCKKYGLNTVLLCLNNEGYMSLFKPGKYMQEWDDARVDITANFILECKAAGLLVGIVFWDHPEDKSGKYYPILSRPDELHAKFIEIVCGALNPYVDLYLIGCESNRYRSVEWVEAAIAATKQFSNGILVGTHEQNVSWSGSSLKMTRRVSSTADFWCYETANHPAKGDSVSVVDMVKEIKFLVENAHGVPVWVGEHNLNILGATSISQARAIAGIEGVYGVDGPM